MLVAIAIFVALPKANFAQRGGGHGGHGRSVSGGHLSNFHSAPSRTYASAPRFERRGGNYHYNSIRGYHGHGYYPSRVIIGHPIYRPPIICHPYPYFWHPYYPCFGWGVGWYPVGTFLAGVATTAIIVGTIENSSDENRSANSTNIYYDNGSFYQRSGNSYRVISAPLGMIVPKIPENATVSTVDGVDYYYFAGVFYQRTDNGYQVIQAPVSAIVYNLPPGAIEVEINGQTYYELSGVYFQPITYNNESAFQVVDHP